MMGLPCPLSRSVAVGRGRCVARNASRESLNRAALLFRLFGPALPPPLPLLRSPHTAAAEAHEMFEMEDRSLEGGKQFARIAASDKRGHNEERGGAQKRHCMQQLCIASRRAIAVSCRFNNDGQSTMRHYCRVTESMTALHHISQPLFLPRSLPPQPI